MFRKENMSSNNPIEFNLQHILNRIYDPTDHTLCVNTPNPNPNPITKYETDFILNDVFDSVNNKLTTK